MSDPRYAVWLQCALGQGGDLPVEILRRSGSFRAFYEGGREEWRLYGRLMKKQLERLEGTPIGDADQIIARCGRLGQRLLTLEDREYPERLRQIEDPPAVLYAAGRQLDFDRLLCITVVGTRDAGPSGVRVAMDLSRQLARAGVVIVSGGALGVDTAAHRGALQAGGRTVAVLGGGLDIRYLPENIPLRNQIKNDGELISEYPPGSPALGRHFPVRNRILSGLSLGTFVVQAGERSGALITARLALEQGRDVFAVPGNLEDDCSRGSNRLLRDGAKPVLEAADILEEYREWISTPRADEPDAPKREPPANREPLSREAGALLNALRTKPLSIDELSVAAGLSPREALAAVTELELEGRIEGLPGKQYRQPHSY